MLPFESLTLLKLLFFRGTTAKVPFEGTTFVQNVSVANPDLQDEPVLFVQDMFEVECFRKEQVEPLLATELFKMHNLIYCGQDAMRA